MNSTSDQRLVHDIQAFAKSFDSDEYIEIHFPAAVTLEVAKRCVKSVEMILIDWANE